jgi:hypothetical protein
VPRSFGEVYTEPLGVSSCPPVAVTGFLQLAHITDTLLSTTTTRFSHPEDGGSTLFRNAGTFTYYTTPKPKIRPPTDKKTAMKIYELYVLNFCREKFSAVAFGLMQQWMGNYVGTRFGIPYCSACITQLTSFLGFRSVLIPTTKWLHFQTYS